MVVEFETFSDLFGFGAFPFCLCTHAIMIFLLCMMSAFSLLFPVLLPMFAVMKRPCRYCVLARFFSRSHLCCGSPSHTGTFGRGRDFLALYFLLALSIIYVWSFYDRLAPYANPPLLCQCSVLNIYNYNIS